MDMSYLMSLLGFLTLARSFLPPELNDFLAKLWEKLIKPVNPFCVFHVPELESNMQNDLYRVVQLHMRAAKLNKDADELVLSRDENEKEITFSLAANEMVTDTYEGVTVWWSHITEKSSSKDNGSEEFEKSEFRLKMRKKDKDFVTTKYLDYVTSNALEYRRQLRVLSLYSNDDCYWQSHNFKHPSNFDTLAMEPELKAKVKADLDSFMRGEEFFHKVGRAWKRGYLLYGPPGTGKSSMIAAIANYLKYNVYDLELTQVFNNNTLKQLLVNTTSKSIIVIEDIDCSLDLAGQRKSGKEAFGKSSNNVDPSADSTSSVTLSGLLNFTDGLWSCCGDERIIIFTTNHVEKLDAALLRPGRMDMHIHMSYCCFETFKTLAKNYLGIDSHPLYDTVKNFLEEGKLITPAQVTEHLFGNKDDPSAAMNALVAWLEKPEELKPDETKATGEDSNEVKKETCDTAAVQENGVKENGVTENGVTENGVAENGVTENGVAKNGVTENGVAENGVTENGVAENGGARSHDSPDDLRQKLKTLEEKIQSIEKILKTSNNTKADIMRNGEEDVMSNGELQMENGYSGGDM